MQHVFRALVGMATVSFCARTLWVALHSDARIAVREPTGDMPFLSIVVPARDEERQIRACVESLLAQRYPSFEVVVVDDRSTDRTRAILAEIASRDARLCVVDGAALPEGWVGKPWALAQGAARSRGEVLFFTDADTVHGPLSASSSVRALLDDRLDALSLLGEQDLDSFAERAILPPIFLIIALAIGSLEAINDPRKTQNAIFNGQYIVMSRSIYDEIDGHASVRGEIAEDFELANLMKVRGYRTRLVEARGIVRTRMYRSFAEIWRGFGKNLSLGARGNTAAAIGGGVWIAFVAPLPQLAAVLAFARRDVPGAAFFIASTVATIVCAEIGMRRSGLHSASAAWLPFGLTVTLAILGKSIVDARRGRLEWRGRRYSA